MERGLLWLPLLGLFSALAWAGWNEYQKLEAYKLWAVSFERAKYDIYAVLGQKDTDLIWGSPTRHGPVDLYQVSLTAIQTIAVYGPERPIPQDANLPRGCQVCIGLTSQTGQQYWIPFTDVELAQRWQHHLQAHLRSIQSRP